MSLPEPYYADEFATLYHADAADILPHLSGVDLVVTDPPYPNQFDHVWDILGDHVPGAMREGAMLFTLLGQYQLPRVIEALSRGLVYRWIGTLPNVSQPIMFGFGVKVCSKPVLMFSKGAGKPHTIMTDDLSRRQRSLDWKAQGLHKWGQASHMAIEPILCASHEGETILDPFVGSGTVMRVAKDLGRKSIGIEIDERNCEIAANQMRQGVLFS